MKRCRLFALGCLLVLAVCGCCRIALAEDAVPIAPGVTYQRIYRPEGPWAINIVEADLSQELIELRAVLGGGDSTGRRPLLDMIAAQATADATLRSSQAPSLRSTSRRPVAAVNADYFALAGWAYTTLPLGLHIQDGELVTFPDPSRSVLYLLADGTAHIDRFRSNSWVIGPGKLLFPLSGLNRPPDPGELTLLTARFGKETRAGEAARQIALGSLSGPPKPNSDVTAQVVSVSGGEPQAIPPDGAVLVASGVSAYALRDLKVGDEVTLRLIIEPRVEGVREAAGGGPRIVRAGQTSVENQVERFADAFATGRHPRTGVGLREGTVVLVTVDGRQPGFSAGMTLQELAQLFLDLGCQEAMNLDGGGSTTMVVRDEVVNSPSDGQSRRIANGWGLFSTAPEGKPVRIAIEPAEASLLSGDRMELTAIGLDEYFNKVPLGGNGVTWQSSPSLGTVDGSGVFSAAEVKWPLTGLVAARWKDLAASTVVRILPAPARLTIVPARASIKPGDTQKFALRAFDENSNPMRVPAARLTWAVEPAAAGASISRQGVLKACARPASLRVIAAVGEASAAADVLVGAATTVLQDFEQPCAVAFQGSPEGVAGDATVADDPLRAGNHCLRISYDFSHAAGTRTAQAELNLPLPETRIISARVLGDGQGAWLRARLRDGAGRVCTVDLADRLDWQGEWKVVTGWLPEEAAQPAVLETIYVTEYHAGRNPVGEVRVDDIGVGSLSVEDSQPGGGGPAAPAPGGGGLQLPMRDLPTYVCRRTGRPVAIDGRLDEPVWSRVPPVGDFRLADGSGEPWLPTELRLCWDESNLYLAFVCIDTDIWGTYRKRDDPVWEEEVAEAFLCSGEDVTKYLEFNFSPHNVVFDARIEIPESGDRRFMKADVSWNCDGLRSAVQVVGTLDDHAEIDDRWTVEAALPFSGIGRDGRVPEDGERWRANFYRIDRAGDGEFSCWSATLQHNFHVPARFGHLVFSAEIV